MYEKPLAPLLLLVVLLLAACEDPSGVGLSLIGESGGEPEVVALDVQAFEEREVPEFMGGAIVVRPNTANPTPRLLSGIVDDPLIGRTEATAFIRFSAVSGISDEFREGPVTAVEVLLRRDYIYGDTTSVVELEVRDVVSSLDELAPVDTTIAPGPIAATTSVVAADQDVVIPMPQDWIDANSEVLRSTDFTTDFRGLSLHASSGNAILGFATDFATLRVVSAGDTIHYAPRSSLTTTTASPRQDSGVLQDGIGHSVVLQLPPNVDELGPAGVNGVVARVPVDTLAMASQRPEHFVRPFLPTARLLVRTMNEDGEFEDAFAVNANLSNGRFNWPIGALPESLFQDLINGEPMELLLTAPHALFTVSPVLLSAPGTGDQAPQIILTLTSATIR